jgi:ferredoxin
MTENMLLGVALSGFEEIILTKGICSQCRFRQGENMLAHSIATFRALLEGMGWNRPPIHLSEKEKTMEENFNRREMLSRISHKIRNKTASLLYQGEKSVREKLSGRGISEDAIGCSPKRELFRELLKKRIWADAAELRYEPGFPWGKIMIDGGKCSACGICSTLCPTGALHKKTAHGCFVIYAASSLCTNCLLCQEACPENVIGFEEHVSLTDMLNDEATLAVKISLNACGICGKHITEGKLCPTCHKRQMVPVHLMQPGS